MMILRNIICCNPVHRRIFLRLCHSQPKNQTETVSRFGYVTDDDGNERREKDNPGISHIGIVKLPQALNDSLELYYDRYPRKQLIDDGLKLQRHIANRGRPSNSTYAKYKKEGGKRLKASRARERNAVKQFNMGDALKDGLVPGESMNETGEVDGDDMMEGNVDADIKDEWEIPTNEKVQEEMEAKKPQLGHYSMIRYGLRETCAFIANQLPAVYASTFKALTEIKRREPDYQPRTVLDFGSGAGMSVWATNEIWKNKIKEFQCVDISHHMNTAAEYLLRGSKELHSPLKIPNVYFKQFLPLSNQIKYDIVISAYTLTEMPFRKQRLQAIQNLWRKTNDFLVIIEPGNNEGFEAALTARSYVTGKNKELEDQYDYVSDFEDSYGTWDLDHGLEDMGHIFAPCTHEMVCARTDVETRDHPCNFAQRVELSMAQKRTGLRRVNFYNERFSYIILRKGENTLDDGVNEWARILSPPKKRKGHVICDLCCHNGNIQKNDFSKTRDPDIYKAARHLLNWGDRMPCDKVRRPMHIRPSPSNHDSD